MNQGGGAVTLTADLIARALIAAARSYGDDPIHALTSQRAGRRSLLPAAAGLSKATGAKMAIVAKLIGAPTKNLARVRVMPGFDQASEAAERAARFAGWKPEARASLVGGDGAEVIRAAPTLSAPGMGLRTLTAKACEREVLDALRDAPATGPALMARLHLGEGQVRQALSALATAAKIEAAPGTLGGWGAKAWKVAA